jgi:predicted Zn-dependent protease
VLGSNLLVGVVSLKFSRGHEAEADDQGVKYMTAAGYDPVGMIEVLQVLQEASHDGRPPEFLSTHPYPESRIETVQGMLDGPYRHTQGNPNYKKYSGRFRREALPYLN